ncbi:hypothetical protein NDU88_004386 [Pleurodeles waltl]|uniref:Uncharacterized protein n=1 Tax=Pleurodeles waltl TaxID=8319 RepID=A0AAV7W846_PLEWA|nr:hypothetical protein NDU88_004386 [Pleurodeles waltl]
MRCLYSPSTACLCPPRETTEKRISVELPHDAHLLSVYFASDFILCTACPNAARLEADRREDSGHGRPRRVSAPRSRHAEERALQRGPPAAPVAARAPGGLQARDPGPAHGRGRPLARQVVRALPERALLLRERAERTPGRALPAGGRQLREGPGAGPRAGGSGRQAGTGRGLVGLSARPASRTPRCLHPAHSAPAHRTQFMES